MNLASLKESFQGMNANNTLKRITFLMIVAVSICLLSFGSAFLAVSLHEEELSDRIDKNTDMVHVIKDEISSFKEVHSTFNRSVNEQSSRIQENNNMIEAVKDEVSSLREAVSTFNNIHNDNSKILVERIKENSNLLKSVVEEIPLITRNLRELSETLGQRIKENSNVIQDADDDISSLRHRVDELSKKQRHSSNGQSRIWMDTCWLGSFSLVIGYMLNG